MEDILETEVEAPGGESLHEEGQQLPSVEDLQCQVDDLQEEGGALLRQLDNMKEKWESESAKW